jgi:hypothetical protein
VPRKENSPRISACWVRPLRVEGDDSDAWDRAVRERVKGAERAGGMALTSGPRRSATECGAGVCQVGSSGPEREEGVGRREKRKGKKMGRGVLGWVVWGLGCFCSFHFFFLFISFPNSNLIQTSSNSNQI